MEIKTNRSREGINARIVPPPDRARHRRKKANRNFGNNRLAGRRFVSSIRILGKVGAFLLVLIFILSVFVHVYTSEQFNLRNITFYGCKELDQKELEEIIRQDFPENILRIDLQQLRDRLEKEIWAKRVEIRRVLPSDLIIYVEERTPSVILELRGALMIADGEGTMLGQYDPRFGKLNAPVFKGVLGDNAENYMMHQTENAARIEQGLAMLAEIESGLPQSTQKISEVDLSDPDNIKIFLVDDSAEVSLGNKDYLKRFRRLMKYQNLTGQDDAIAKIDMRIDDRITYSRRQESFE